MEGDPGISRCLLVPRHFNPLPPHGGRPNCTVLFCASIHFNPLPPHGGRLHGVGRHLRVICISIHSLRMEGDSSLWRYRFPFPHFNPLPPHGGRQLQDCYNNPVLGFQSTPSAWRETLAAYLYMDKENRISIHSLRMEGDKGRQRAAV